MPEHRVFILSGPSGAGKTSLAQALVQAVPEALLSVSHTTRPRRPGEHDGHDYHFVDRRCFEGMIARDSFLEYAEVFDHLYGTSRETVANGLAAGRHVVLDIDWQGARQVRQRQADVRSIFVLPPSLEELERRLRGRGQDEEAVIRRRMREAVDEMRHFDEYDYLVVNDSYQAALDDLVNIVAGHPERARAHGAELAVRLLGDGAERSYA